MKRSAPSGLFMRVPEIATELGVSYAYVYRLVATGQVPAVRRGRSILVPRRAWRAWMRGQTEAALAALRDTAAIVAGNSGH